MVDRAAELRTELAELLAKHGPMLSDGERAELLLLEQRGGWRPGRRPTRPELRISAFLDLFDRAEQEELAGDRMLAGGSMDDLRRVFREQLSAEG